MIDIFEFAHNPLDILVRYPNNYRDIVELIEIIDRPSEQEILLDYILDKIPSNTVDLDIIAYAFYLKYHLFDKLDIFLLEQTIYYGSIFLETNQNDIFIKSILAWAYYDLGKFNLALDILIQIPFGVFSNHKYHQTWKDLFNEQLKICCLIQLGDFSNINELLFDFFEKISNCQSTDIPDTYLLAEAIKKLSNKNNGRL